jgi:hypothetical protein
MKAGGIRIRRRSMAQLLRDVDAGRFAIPIGNCTRLGTPPVYIDGVDFAHR